MNDRALSGVLMLGAAAAIAWAYFTGRLDGTLAQLSAKAAGPLKPRTASPTGGAPQPATDAETIARLQ